LITDPRLRRAARLALVAALAIGGAACRQDMHNQPRYRPLRASKFFADGMSARPLIEGTVARGHLDADPLLYTGKGPGGAFAAAMPPAMKIDRAFLERGRQRFDIYCSPCHGRTGDGNGMVVRRGFKRPPSYHQDRLRDEPLGYFFDVITHGFGVMPSYAVQVPVQDRWAIAAYIRVLQGSQRAHLADLGPADQQQLAAIPAAEPVAAPITAPPTAQPANGQEPAPAAASPAPAASTPGSH
jgi:mono/diheme cytochrome c family protein